MNDHPNPVNWFEIPVVNIERAKQFYEHMLNINMQRVDLGELKMCWFPSNPQKPGASGALVEHPSHYQPVDNGGVILYLACEDVAGSLEKAQKSGGKIIQNKKEISPEHGFMGLLIDCEGNKIALHSYK